MKSYGMRKYSCTFLNLCTAWRLAVSFKFLPLYTSENAPVNPLMGGWVDSRTCLDVPEQRKISCPSQEPNHVRVSAACRYTDRVIRNICINLVCNKRIPWFESARELYWPSDRRLSAKLVPIFLERGVSRGQLDGSVRPWSWSSRPEPLLFLFKYLLNCIHEAEWTPFQTHYFSGKLVAPGIEPGPLTL
jgi:hypothetical protein